MTVLNLCGRIGAVCLAILITGWPGLAWSGPLDSVPLRSGAQVPEYCALGGKPITVTIKAKGANGTTFFTPWTVEYILDVAVEGGKQIMITLITDEQYKALSAGRKPANPQPPMKEILSGVDQASVTLQRGNYFFGFNNQADTPTRVTYRCSIVRK